LGLFGVRLNLLVTSGSLDRSLSTDSDTKARTGSVGVFASVDRVWHAEIVVGVASDAGGVATATWRRVRLVRKERARRVLVVILAHVLSNLFYDCFPCVDF